MVIILSVINALLSPHGNENSKLMIFLCYMQYSEGREIYLTSDFLPFSIIILSLITIIGVVSCFILCNEERELMQEVALDTPLREAYENIIRNLESGGEALTANNDLDAAEDNEMMTGEFKNDNSARFVIKLFLDPVFPLTRV